MYTVKILAALVLALLLPPLWVDVRLAVCRLQIAALRRRKKKLLEEKEICGCNWKEQGDK